MIRSILHEWLAEDHPDIPPTLIFDMEPYTESVIRSYWKVELSSLPRREAWALRRFVRQELGKFLCSEHDESGLQIRYIVSRDGCDLAVPRWYMTAEERVSKILRLKSEAHAKGMHARLHQSELIDLALNGRISGDVGKELQRLGMSQGQIGWLESEMEAGDSRN